MRIIRALVLASGILVLGGLAYAIYLFRALTGPPPPLLLARATSKTLQLKMTAPPCNGNVQEAKLVRKTAPKYAELARQMRWRPPFVQMDVTLSEEGKVEKTNIIRGHPLCDDAVREALEQWKYSPTFCNGIPAKVMIRLRLPCGDPYRGKLDPAVALLIYRLRMGTTVDPGENTFVKGGRAFIEVTLSASSQRQAQILTQLGFIVTGRANQPGVFIGHVATDRLDLLRASKAVTFIAPRPD